MPVPRKPRRYIDPVQRQRNRNEVAMKKARELMEPCVFCDLIEGGLPEVTKDTGIYVLEPLYPVTPGHLLILPREHFPYPDRNPAVAGLVMTQAAKVARKGPYHQDYNYIINSGPAASQTVKHLHLHLIPRKPGDGLILPWTNQNTDWDKAIYDAMYEIEVDHLVTVDAAESVSKTIHAGLKKQGVI